MWLCHQVRYIWHINSNQTLRFFKCLQKLKQCFSYLFSRGDLTVERFVKVYDFRMMRAVSPIQVPIDPMFLRFVPQYSERICVVSQVS